MSQEQQQPLLTFCLRQKVFTKNSFVFTCYLWLQNRKVLIGWQFGSELTLAKVTLRDVNILLLASLDQHQFLNEMFIETFWEEHREHSLFAISNG